jgi:hypothetical protein
LDPAEEYKETLDKERLLIAALSEIFTTRT